MQTHKFERQRIHPWNASPEVHAILWAAQKDDSGSAIRKKAERIKKGMRAMAFAHQDEAEVQERWHALVRFDDRKNPIKFVAMTRREALKRNATIHDIGMEWVMRDR